MKVKIEKRGPLFAAVMFVTLLVIASFTPGCGIWDDITGEDEVMIKGDSGTSCSLDSECRSNSCIYPGICE